MLEQALAFLAMQAQDAAKPIKIREDHEGEEWVFGEQHFSFEKEISPRKHKFDDLSDLLEFLDGIEPSESDHHRVIVWYDLGQITAVIDNDERRLNTATLAIKATPYWKTVLQLGLWLEQKEFIRLLRLELDIPGVSEVLEKVRKIRFENGVVTSQTRQRDQESMGREITSRVTVDGELPDELTIAFMPFDVRGLEYYQAQIKLFLEVDTSRGMFRLIPAPRQLDLVANSFLSHLGREVKRTIPHIPVYNGRPD